MPNAINFLLCTETKHVSVRELFEICRPLEENARSCAEAWNLPAPTVSVIDGREHLKVDAMHNRRFAPIVFLDDDSKAASDTLASHYFDPVTLFPAGRVFVEKASGFHTGPYSVFEATAHEILESLVDPDLRYWIDHPDPARKGIQLAVEVCDAVQDTYPIAHHGTTWPAANFITPEWFSPKFFSDAIARKALLKSGRGFDYSRKLHMPAEVGPEGYTLVRDSDRLWAEARTAPNTEMKAWIPRTLHEAAAKRHAWARTTRRGLQF